MNLYKEHRINPGKPEMVLLHGWGMSSRVWGDFAEALAPFFSLTLIDLPGLGRSNDFPDPYTSDAVVDWVLADAPEKAIWVGWSLGGQIATLIAACYPARVDKLVTIASNPCFVARDDWECAMDEQTHQQFESGLAQSPAKTLSRFAMLQTQGALESKITLKHLKAVLSEEKPVALQQSLSLLREDVRPEFAKLTQPVLQLLGERDLLVPAGVAETCLAPEKCTVKVYPESGHLPFYSHQQQVVNDILSFVNGQTL